MMARWIGLIVLAGASVVAAAQQPAAPAARPQEPPKLKLTSPAFTDGAMLPKALTALRIVWAPCMRPWPRRPLSCA